MTNINNIMKKLKQGKYFYHIASIPWIIFMISLAIFLIKRSLTSFIFNDDFYMSMILSGSFGEPSPYAIYINILLSQLITIFQKVAPLHNWFLLLQLAAIFFSYIVLGVWNIIRNKLIVGYLSSLIFVFATIDYVACRITYTKTGALLMSVGLVILISSLADDNWRRPGKRLVQILGTLMVFCGGLFRKEIVLASLPFAVVGLFYLIRSAKKDGVKRLVSYTIVFWLLLIAWIGQRVVYSSDEDWKYYNEYNKYRTSLLDYYTPDYDDYTIELSGLGLSRLDYRLLSSWTFFDGDVFSLDILKNVVDFRDSIDTRLSLSDKIDETSLEMIEWSQRYLTFYIVLLVFFAFTFLCGTKDFFYRLAVVLLGLGEIWYLIYSGRIMEHVFFLALLYAFASTMLFSHVDESNHIKPYYSFIILALISIFTYYSCNYSDIKKREIPAPYDTSQADAIFEYTSQNSDCLFAMDIFDNNRLLSEAYSSFGPFSQIPHDNIAITGGWFIPSPIFTNMLEPFGDKHNLIKLLATNEKVFWISPIEADRDQFFRYVRENYNPEAQLYIVDEIGDYYILSFSDKYAE